MKFGYMGLTQPYDTTWSDGRLCRVYPNGEVISLSDGQKIRYPDIIESQNNPKNIYYSPSDQNTTLLIIALTGIIIIGIIVVSKK